MLYGVLWKVLDEFPLDNYISVVYTLDIMKAVITLKTDREVKHTAQKLAADLGLTLSAVVNASLRQFIRDSGVHFSRNYVMTPELEKIIEKARSDRLAGKNISPIFDSAEDLIKSLNS